MPPIILPTTVAPVTMRVPIAGWVIVGTGLYLIGVTILICIRQCLVRSGFCSDCLCFGKADEPTNCWVCCIECAQVCDCTTPDVKSCCDSICGPRRRCDIDDCFSCCGGGGGECCESTSIPLCQCPSCPDCSLDAPDCECNEIVCCCVRISIMSPNPA